MIETRELEPQDADGNRGIYMYDAELEPSDSHYVKQLILEHLIFVDPEDYDSSMEVELCGRKYDIDYKFDVEIADYITEQEYIETIGVHYE